MYRELTERVMIVIVIAFTVTRRCSAVDDTALEAGVSLSASGSFFLVKTQTDKPDVSSTCFF